LVLLLIDRVRRRTPSVTCTTLNYETARDSLFRLFLTIFYSACSDKSSVPLVLIRFLRTAPRNETR
jgi:hypothetical protein